MPQTTSLQTRSKRRTSKGLLLVLVGVWGCAPDPEVVYIELDGVELRSSSPAGQGSSFSADAYSIEKTVPQMEGTDVFFGSAEERALEALSVYREAQRAAARAVLDRLKRAYLNEVDQEVKSEKDVARAQYSESMQQEVDALYALFIEHARAVEPLRYELTQIVGFPDPDPFSLKVPLEANERAYSRFLRARAIREEIIAEDSRYKAEVSRRMSALEEARQSGLASIDLRGVAMQDDALRRAQEEADRVTKDALAALEPTALDREAQLPAVPGASSSVNSGQVSIASPPASGAERETRKDLEAQVEVFLKTNRYRRTRDASVGRNVTQEFLEWRRKFRAGR